MSLNSFIVRDTEDGKKVNSHRHIWEKPPVIFCFHLPFSIQPGSRFLFFLAVAFAIFSSVFDGFFLDLCFQALFWLSGEGCWAFRRHWRERANNSQGISVAMCAARVLGPRRVPFAVQHSDSTLLRPLKTIFSHGGKTHVRQEGSVSLALFKGHLKGAALFHSFFFILPPVLFHRSY